MSMKAVVRAFQKLDTQVAQTMQDMVRGMVGELYNTFNGEYLTKSEVIAVQDAITSDAPWKGTSSEGARRSEIKACLNAYPIYFGEACTMFRKQHGELRRTHVLMLARALPSFEGYKDAVASVIKRIKAKKVTTVVKPEKALQHALSTIRGLETRSQKIIKFRKALAVLVAEYGI